LGGKRIPADEEKERSINCEEFWDGKEKDLYLVKRGEPPVVPETKGIPATRAKRGKETWYKATIWKAGKKHNPARD